MNVDADDSRLSAYLDDELDAAQRSALETALLADARLAERLQELAAVRNLVGSLPRPAVALDLSGLVLARIEASAWLRMRNAFRNSPSLRHAARVASGLASAAAVLILATWPTRPVGPAPAPGANETAPTQQLATNSPPALPDPVGQSAPVPVSTPSGAEPGQQALAATAPVPDRDAETSQDRDRLRALLDAPDVRRLLLVVDKITPNDLRKVEGAIKQTGRAQPLYGEICIAQGIEIDPQRPNQAVVFAVVLDAQEYRNLDANLRMQFPELAPEVEPAPSAVVAKLADVGQVILNEGSPSSPLRPIPQPGGLGTLAFGSKVHDPERLPMDRSRPDVTDAQTAGAPNDGLTDPSNAARAGVAIPPRRLASGEPPEGPASPPDFGTPAGDAGPHVYLVWVTTRSSSPSGPAFR